MKAFLYSMVGLYVFDILSRLFWLATGRFPERTPGQVALDAAINAGILVWIIYLLASGSA